jgi:hypothetical protein
MDYSQVSATTQREKKIGSAGPWEPAGVLVEDALQIGTVLSNVKKVRIAPSFGRNATQDTQID